MGEAVHGQAVHLAEAEVGYLDFEVGGDEQVLGFEVAMQDAHGVAVGDAEQHLLTHALDLLHGERMFVDLLAQVLLLVLEDQLDLAVLADYLEQLGDVQVVQVAEQRDFAQGGHGDALLPRLRADLLERHCVSVLLVDGLEDHTLSALT